MINKFVVSTELQQFLSGIPSPALSNILWDIQFTNDALPVNPSAVRRVLMFDKVDFEDLATPSPIYDCYLQALDGSALTQVTFPRGT